MLSGPFLRLSKFVLALLDFLVRAKLPVKSEGNEGSGRCGGKRCGVCPFIKETDSFSDKGGKGYKIRAKNLNSRGGTRFQNDGMCRPK